MHLIVLLKTIACQVEKVILNNQSSTTLKEANQIVYISTSMGIKSYQQTEVNQVQVHLEKEFVRNSVYTGNGT